jgi:hypothetical protein
MKGRVKMSEQLTLVTNEKSLEQCVDECAALAERKSAIEAEMKILRAKIIAAAEFPEGKNTTKILGNTYIAKVERKNEIKYLKEPLKKAMDAIDPDTFKKLFDWEFTAKAKKPDIDAFIEFNPHGALIGAARQVIERSPSVSFDERGV